jgi:segregation and condensation protein A
VREKMTHLLDILRAHSSILFESLFAAAGSRMEIIVTFLAMLELVKVRAIRIVQEEMAGPIKIEAAADMDGVAENAVLNQSEEDPYGA